MRKLSVETEGNQKLKTPQSFCLLLDFTSDNDATSGHLGKLFCLSPWFPPISFKDDCSPLSCNSNSPTNAQLGYASGSGTCSHLLDTITEMTDRTRETGAGSFTIETNVPAGGYDASTGYDITLSNGGAAFEGFLLYATQAADVAGTVR